jgi:hypothetical protein
MKRLFVLPLLTALFAAPLTAQTAGNVRPLAALNSATGQVAATTSRAVLAPVQPTRQELLVTVPAGATCAVGGVAVTLLNGLVLPAGVTTAIHTRTIIYVICSGSVTVSYLDAF